MENSPKSRLTASLLCWLLGIVGAHRFYASKKRTAILMLLTLGGFFVWWLVDLIVVVTGNFRDSEGRKISVWGNRSALDRKIYKLLLAYVLVGAVSLVVLAISGGSDVPRQVEQQPKQDNFTALAHQRFDDIKKVAPEIDSIDCEGNCRDIAYFRLNKIPDDLDFFIRGNTATFANFDLENGGDGSVAIIATYQDRVIKKCYSEKGATGKGVVKSCE